MLLLACLSATTAVAAPRHVVDVIEGSGQTGGVAVNEATSDLYVVDRTNNLVRRFDAGGSFLSEFGSGGSGDGEFDGPSGVAIDQADQSLYVTDQFNSRVQKFNALGSFLLRFGEPGSGDGQFGPLSGYPAVDPSSGDVYVPDQENARVQRFDSTGVFMSKFGSPGSGDGQFAGPVRRVAVDSAGNVYVADSGSVAVPGDNTRVLKFDSSGAFVEVFAAPHLSGRMGEGVLLAGEIAVDPATDHVFATRHGLGETEIVELDPSGNLVEVHGQTDGLPMPTGGLAVDSASGRIYLSEGDGSRVFVLDSGVVPTAEFGDVSDVVAESATFSGTVNPNGFETRFRFEYSTDGIEWTPSTGGNVGSGTSAVEVSETVGGLDPNTEYRVRLVADGFGPPVVSSEQTFATDTAPPVVATAFDVAGTSVTLRGEVKPNNLQTTYRFEYGTDASYGSSVPVPDGDAGSGLAPLQVSQQVDGLHPNTVFHFRLVATNAAGAANSADRIFRTSSAEPPPGRAYEKVSPADKGGLDLMRQAASQSSVSGDRVVFPAWASFAGSAGHPLISHYLASREPTSWLTVGISPPMTALVGGFNQSLLMGVSRDLSRAVVRSNAALDPAAPPSTPQPAEIPLYLYDFSTRSYTLLTAQRLDGAGPYAVDFLGGDADFSHVLFESEAALTPDALGVAGVKLYKWASGDLTLESVLPGGIPVAGSGGGVDVNFLTISRNELIDNAISEDGSRVFFTSVAVGGGSGGDLYVREGGETTLVAAGTGFLAATPDGRYVFHGGGRYDVETGVTTPLPLPAGGSQTIGVSNDGSRMYFMSGPGLVPGGPSDPGLYIYLWDDGVTKFVAGPFPDGSFLEPLVRRDAEQARQERYVSPDGSALLFRTRAPLTGFDNRNPDCSSGLCLQVFLYRADASTPTAPELLCVSCNRDGTQPRGDASLWGLLNEIGPLWESMDRRNLSADGKRAFFESPDALVPRDTNGELDLYMWERGEVELVSSGTSDAESYFADASASGDDVFFVTSDRLVTSDVDGLMDLYDARVGGGLPEQRAPLSCAGDECQGVPAGRPALGEPTTSLFQGAGDLAPPPRPSLRVLRLSRSARARIARTGRLTLRVRVNRAGRVYVSARARVDGRMRRVARTSKTARSAGAIALSVRLSKAARVQLARRRSLKVKLEVRFRGERRQLMVALRRPRSATAGGRRSARRTVYQAGEAR